MADFYVGMVQAFPYNFVVKGWLACNGQLLPLQSYPALYSLIGAYYGGNGTTNFALPSLNKIGNSPAARTVGGYGQGPGLSPRSIGEVDGEDTHTLSYSEMPNHNHPLTLWGSGSTRQAAPVAGGTLLDPGTRGFPPFVNPSPTTLSPTAVGMTGSGQPHNNDQPVLALYWQICYDGIYPSFS